MGKRFTDSDKWKDKWFRGLSAVEKLAYMYCLDNCDHAGVIEIDEELADFQIGSSVEWAKFFEKCDGRLMKLDCGKWWVVKFISYQYGSISEGCKAHNPVFASIEKYQLRKAMERVSKGYSKGIQRVQDMDKDKDKDTDKDTDKVKDKDQGGAGGKFSTSLPCPPDVDPDSWRDWNAVRKAKKLGAATQSVYDSVKREAEKAGLTVGQAIEIAAGESWGGFKATWLDRAKSRDASKPQTFAQISLENSRRAMEEFING